MSDSFLAAPDMVSNVNSLTIVTSSTCEPRAIVTSHWSIVLTLCLWTLSSSQWRCQPGRFSMAAHRHDRRVIYRCVLLRVRGRIEIDHSYGLRWRGLCCHSRHSTWPRDHLYQAHSLSLAHTWLIDAYGLVRASIEMEYIAHNLKLWQHFM